MVFDIAFVAFWAESHSGSGYRSARYSHIRHIYAFLHLRFYHLINTVCKCMLHFWTIKLPTFVLSSKIRISARLHHKRCYCYLLRQVSLRPLSSFVFEIPWRNYAEKSLILSVQCCETENSSVLSHRKGTLKAFQQVHDTFIRDTNWGKIRRLSVTKVTFWSILISSHKILMINVAPILRNQYLYVLILKFWSFAEEVKRNELGPWARPGRT